MFLFIGSNWVETIVMTIIATTIFIAIKAVVFFIISLFTGKRYGNPRHFGKRR